MAGAVPTPPVAAVGQQLSASWWNNSAEPPLSFLQDPPKCSVYNSTGVSIANAAANGTLMTYDTETEDSDNMHSTSTNLGRITMNTPGRYDYNIFSMLPNVPTTYSQYVINARINSGGVATGGTSIRSWDFSTPGGAPCQASISFSKVFAIGDYVEVFYSQTSGSARTTNTSGQYCNGVQARWVSIN